MRRQIYLRDRHCRFKGCAMTKALEVHHVVAWAKGGSHDPDNLILVCTTHHHAVHEGGFTIAGKYPDLTIKRPDGTTIRIDPPTPWDQLEIDFELEYASGWDP